MVKITDYPTTSTVGATDVFEVVDVTNNVSKQVQAQNMLPAGSVTTSKLNLSSSIAISSNSGSAGGNYSYVNVGGLKYAFGVTPNLNAAAQSSSIYTVTLPAGFFSSAPAVTGNPHNNVGVDNMFVYLQSATTTTTITFGLRNNFTSAGTAGISWIAVGT